MYHNAAIPQRILSVEMDKANAGKEMLQVSHTKDETERLTVDHHTERKPIGVAETGVLIRKTSIRVRLN